MRDGPRLSVNKGSRLVAISGALIAIAFEVVVGKLMPVGAASASSTLVGTATYWASACSGHELDDDQVDFL